MLAKYWLGCSGYSYDDWVGNFYPPGLDKSLFFKYYSERFNTVEINSSFYQIPKRSSVLHWAKHAPSYFRFSMKLYREITHDRKLFNVKPVLDKFSIAIKPLLDKNLVSVFLIQLPASFGKNLPKLEDFFSELPSSYKYAIEFRHHSWLEDDTFELLEKYNIAYTIVDEPHLPPIVKITADFPYGGVTLKVLSFVNKIIFSYLEKENILGEDFVVEVVSPGLDRKLKEKSDFLRVLGRHLKIWLKSPYEGKNYYEGILEKIEEENLIIKSEKIISIPLSLINFAKQRIE